MKKFLLGILSFLVVGLLAIFIKTGCTAPTANTPLDITTAAIMSLEAGDIDDTSSYFKGTAYNRMREGLKTFFIYNDITITDVVVDVLDESNTIAKVYIEYKLSYSSMGYTDTQQITKTVRCVKTNDQWYLNTPL